MTRRTNVHPAIRPVNKSFVREPLAAQPSLHILDVTMFWAARGGGVKRYLEAKHAFLESQPACRHTICVPGTFAARAPQLPGLPLPFSSGYRLPRSKRSASKVLRELAPDVIEAGDPYQLAWSALLSGEELQVPVVAFYHSDLPSLFGRLLGTGIARAAGAYARKLYTRFDAVFAPSRWALNNLRELGIHSAVHQPLGVDTSTFHPVRRDENWRVAVGLPKARKVLLYVGRYAPEKNLDVLCEAAERLRDTHVLALMGGGTRIPSGSNIKVLPYEARTDALATAMASADAFVHAGEQETFGLAALEAMASGVPVIASRNGGIGELVDDSVGCTVARATPEAFVDAIRALGERDQKALCDAARERAQRYDWNAVLPPLLEHYRRLAAASRDYRDERAA